MEKIDSSKPFQLNQSILERKIKVVRPPPLPKKVPSQALGSKPTNFSQKEESDLVHYVLQLQKILFRITIYDVRSLAEQILRNNKKDRKLRATPCATGHQWVLDFLKRYPKVILRLPSSNTATTIGFNMAELEHFYQILGHLYSIQKITPDRIYNSDDVEISILGKDNKTFISAGNKIAYRAVTDNVTVNVKICVDANGQILPSMMIFPLKHFRPDPMINVSQKTWVVCTDADSITTELFTQWLRNFIAYSGAKEERPVVLLFDGQAAYIKNIEVIKIASENGIIMISFPPHTRRLLQPLSEEFVSSLNKCYVDLWIQSNLDHTVSAAQVVDLFHKALKQAATPSYISDRFKNSGIFPLDSTIFKESDFIPPVSNNVHINEIKAPPPTKTFQDSLFTTSSVYYFDLYKDPRPGCSFWPD